MDDLYRENILDHYNNPRNFGKIPGADFTMEQKNVSCGDYIGIQVKIDKSGRSVTDIHFTGTGCAISIASASMMSEKVKGMDISEIRKMNSPDIIKMLGIKLSPVRLKCALLPLEVLQKILNTLPLVK